MPSRHFDIELDDSFREACLQAIRDDTEISNRNRQVWFKALHAGHNNVFLALLISTLPNLAGLFLGAGNIFHYPMLFRDADPWRGPMSPWLSIRSHWDSRIYTDQLRDHNYLGQICEHIYSRLTKLECHRHGSVRQRDSCLE